MGDEGPATGAATARDVSAAVRGPERLVHAHGGTYLLPTVIRCDAVASAGESRVPVPLRQRRRGAGRRICPASSGRRWSSPASRMIPRFRARFVASPHVDRLNFGPHRTTQIGWDQPHEGNLFEHLYARRAIQRLA